MRTVRRAMALALLMGAPVLAPVVLMNQALAQEGQNQQQAPAEQLDPELEQALAEALQGTPEQVQAQLQALLTNNPAQATAIANRARAVAPANVVAVVNNVTQTVINNQPAANNQANNQQGTEQGDNNQNQNPVAGNQLAGNNNQGTGNGQQGSSGGALVIPGSNGNGVVLNAVNFDQFQVAGGLAFLANNPTFVPGGTTQAPNFLVGPVFSNWLDRIDSTPVCFLGASSSINIGPYGSTTSPIRFNNGC